MRFSGEPFGSPERLRCLLVGLITGRVIAPPSGSSIARGSSRTAFSSQNTANCRYSLRSESLTAARTQPMHWSACSRYTCGDNTYRLHGRPTKYISTPPTEVQVGLQVLPSTNLSRASASNFFLRPEQLIDRRLASLDGHLSGAFHFAAFRNDRSRRRIIGPSPVIFACSVDAKLIPR